MGPAWCRASVDRLGACGALGTCRIPAGDVWLVHNQAGKPSELLSRVLAPQLFFIFSSLFSCRYLQSLALLQVCPSPCKELEQGLRKAAYETMPPLRDAGISFEEVSSLFFCQPLLSYSFPAPTAAIKRALLWSASLIHSLGPASTDECCFCPGKSQALC